LRPAYFTVSDTARNVQVPERTLRRWIRSGALPVAYDKRGRQLTLVASAEHLAIDRHSRRGRQRPRPPAPLVSDQ
jgi:predicted site-specific integrase-resolvase